ncbi:MAG TPA: hypothetical protein VEG30_01560 [Terriglobales bacterium]|nr:hypothetical protein [Terriglobales bacterium]
MSNRLTSDFLIAEPSFISGVGRLLDWYGLYDVYNASQNGREADTKAMFADWYIVGQDIKDAMMEFESDQLVK